MMNGHRDDISKLKDGMTSDPATWMGQSIISVTQLAPSGLELLMKTACEMRELVRTQGGDERLKHRVLSTIFYEASTRTACSFQIAMMRLGGTVMHIDASAAGNTSSKKGETVYDTVRCLQSYTDVTVLRHDVKGTVTNAFLVGGLSKPLINAGDGIGEHPSQALLDLFTIMDELDMMEAKGDGATRDDSPLTVVMVGDLKHGRTVHSLAKLLARAQSRFLKRPLVLRYCSPESLKMPEYIKEYVEQYSAQPESRIIQEEYTCIRDAMRNANILYTTRIQKERFLDIQEYNDVAGCYVVNKELMNDAPEKMIVMHPLPRVDEISTDVDTDPRAAYFRQMENGLYVRMAILALVLGKS